MPKFDVQLCQEVWKYYRIDIDADTEEQAKEMAVDIWNKTGGLEFDYEPGEDDGNGVIVTDCREVHVAD